MKRFLARRETVPAVLVLVALGIGAIESPYFLDVRYLLDSSSTYVEGGLLVLGMTLVIIAGQIDLSVASMTALVACSVAKGLDAGWPAWTALPGGVLLGCLLGWFNGIVVTRFGLPSFVVTLATLAGYRGAAQAMVGASSVRFPPSLTGFDRVYLPGTPIPMPLVIFAVAAVAIGVLLHGTVFGRWVYAVGANARAALFSGVPVARVTTATFVISGLMAGLAGILIDSRLGVARFDDAKGLELDVITAVVVGGTAITGGSGSILGSVLALVLIALIRIGMLLANVSAEYQLAALGSLLIVSVIANNLAARFAQSRAKALHNQSA